MLRARTHCRFLIDNALRANGQDMSPTDPHGGRRTRIRFGLLGKNLDLRRQRCPQHVPVVVCFLILGKGVGGSTGDNALRHELLCSRAECRHGPTGTSQREEGRHVHLDALDEMYP
jgi:hypothetical protein